MKMCSNCCVTTVFFKKHWFFHTSGTTMSKRLQSKKEKPISLEDFDFDDSDGKVTTVMEA